MGIKNKIIAIKERNKKKKEDRAKEITEAEEFVKNVFPTEEEVVTRWSDRIESALSSEKSMFLIYLSTEFPYIHDLVQKELQRRINIHFAPKDEKLLIMEAKDEGSLG